LKIENRKLQIGSNRQSRFDPQIGTQSPIFQFSIFNLQFAIFALPSAIPVLVEGRGL
jgi:hypothetical protein